MTRRHDLQRHIGSLQDIHKIVHSMQSLAYIETRKLSRHLENQQRLVQAVERAAMDFLAFYPGILPPAPPSSTVILIGSERGFCGDFNEQLVDYLGLRMQASTEPGPFIIAVGQRLCSRLQDQVPLATDINGADVAEEIDRVLVDILEAVDGLREREGAVNLSAVFHRAADCAVTEKTLLPPFGPRPVAKVPSGIPPLLNLAPKEFLFGLVEHHLLAALHEVLYASLMAENRRRVQQLEGACRHLDGQLEALGRRGRQLRQEEIIEEIEVILLGAAGV